MKKVLIIFDSWAIGDSIAWIESCEKFRQINNCDVFVYMERRDLFEKAYPNIIFVEGTGPLTVSDFNESDFDEVFTLTWKGVIGRDCSLQNRAANILDIPFNSQEFNSKIQYEKTDRPDDIPPGKYICISVQSTAQAKFWNYKNGWETIIEYLNGIGYNVVCIDKHKQFGTEGFMNKIPSNCIDRTGLKSEFGDLTGVMKYLQHSEFFIGLGSGLSWLAWAMKIPVILVSNFSPPWYEFQTNVVRVYKDSPVSGYFTEHNFDIGNWNWCPIKEINTMQDWYDLEQITPDDVMNSIDKCIGTLLK